MPVALPGFLPAEGMKILFVLFLSFLIGIEREEHKASGDKYVFGGVRTFPLIGLLGYAMALLSEGSLLPLTVGFAVIAAFLWLSYQYKLQAAEGAGVTTEISGLTTYVAGALVSKGNFWIAGTLCVLSVLLLELKIFLEGLSKKISADEILTFTKFLLLTIVILPVVPNQDLTAFRINPYKTWLVVTAVSAISYGSYLLQVLTKGKGGMLLAAILGGAYSSTLTTIVIARRAKEEQASYLYAGAILMASGMMYLRLVVLIGIFNQQLAAQLAVPFLGLAVLGLAGGWLWSRQADRSAGVLEKQIVARNPLELWVAFLFGAVFVAMLVLTGIAVAHLGERGLFTLAAIMGVMDVDPFILSLTQTGGAVTTVALAAAGILIATASNNLIKGFYAFGIANRKTGLQSLCLLLALSLAGLVPLFWVFA